MKNKRKSIITWKKHNLTSNGQKDLRINLYIKKISVNINNNPQITVIYSTIQKPLD